MNKPYLKISRTGSARRCGTTSIQITPGYFHCNQSGINFGDLYVDDFNGQSRHDYTIAIPHEVFLAFIKSVSEAALKNPNAFEKILEPSLKNLSQLQAVASGTLSNRDALQQTDRSLSIQRLTTPNTTALPYIDSQCKTVNLGRRFITLRNKNA